MVVGEVTARQRQAGCQGIRYVHVFKSNALCPHGFSYASCNKHRKLIFEDISPVLDFWWHLPWVSNSGSIPCLCASSLACNGFQKFTFGVTPADLLMASIAAELFWSMCLYTCTSIDGSRTRHRVYSIACAPTVSAAPTKHPRTYPRLQGKGAFI